MACLENTAREGCRQDMAIPLLPCTPQPHEWYCWAYTWGHIPKTRSNLWLSWDSTLWNGWMNSWMNAWQTSAHGWDGAQKDALANNPLESGDRGGMRPCWLPSLWGWCGPWYPG